jgi:hypothetical protein
MTTSAVAMPAAQQHVRAGGRSVIVNGRNHMLNLCGPTETTHHVNATPMKQTMMMPPSVPSTWQAVTGNFYADDGLRNDFSALAGVQQERSRWSSWAVDEFDQMAYSYDDGTAVCSRYNVPEYAPWSVNACRRQTITGVISEVASMNYG